MIRYLWRWLVLLVLCVTGYANSVGQLLATGSPTGIAYTVAAASMAVVMFLGVELRRRPDLPIHDREVDWIVGVMALILAVSLRTMLAPRLIEWSDLLRLDVLSLIVFTFGASALLFGSRSTLRFGAAWAVLVIYNGPVYALVTLLCGGGWAGSALATTLGVTVALVAVNDGSARRRTVVVGISFGVGALLCLIGQLLPGAGTRGADTAVAMLTCLPGLAGAVVASLTEIRVRQAQDQEASALRPRRTAGGPARARRRRRPGRRTTAATTGDLRDRGRARDDGRRRRRSPALRLGTDR
ncbi:hypothetical protein [Corynebacterium provencense]|uniref:hypothetical protein n=1 Tax=Corynebacterium provencense TaxID=1737425 RepID=UPI000D7C00A9|nr:hypothetical protein [Corynebacterium provencense]